MSMMTREVMIPDLTAPNRPPDGSVGNYWFWLGSDGEIEDMADEQAGDGGSNG